MMTIKEALARANADDAESLEALTRALLRGGHGPDVARVLALLELDIMERRDTTMTLAEVQRRQAQRAEERRVEEEERAEAIQRRQGLRTAAERKGEEETKKAVRAFSRYRF